MNPDMCVPCGDGLVNIRVGAIIIKNGRLLMAHNGRGYLYSVGGRLRFGETSEEAVMREVYEETGVRLEVDRLGFVHENYFFGDMESNLGKLIYEVSFYCYMKVPDGFEPLFNTFFEGEVREYLEWVAPDDKRTIFPDFFRTELDAACPGVKHFVTDGRIKP